ncbi:MAG: methyl-accepting chemotaxis protein [Proteobacteria bacterium]|nr:methyl-accepting chemotaxis protein [Pseudomonadota bacterium]
MAFKLKLPNFKTSSAAAAQPLPLIGHLPFTRQLRLLGGGLAVTFLLGAAAIGLDYRTTSNNEHHLELSGDFVMLVQRVAKDAGSALQGKQTAVEGLPQARADLQNILTALDKGDDVAPGLRGAPRATLDALMPVYNESMQYIKDIEQGRPGILTVSRAMDAVREVAPPIRAAISRLPASSATDKFALLIERIDYDTSSTLSAVVTDEMVSALASDMTQASLLLNGFDKNNPIVVELTDLFEGYRNSVDALVSQAKGLQGAKIGASKYFDNVSVTKKGPFVIGAVALKNAIASSSQGRWTIYVTGLSAALLMLFAAALSKVYLAEARHRAAMAEASNKLNQRAILRLMNELSDLAEGDLTVRATVTEDITGAIADSINYTAEELHKLVTRITEAAEQMGQATSDSEGMAQRLLISTQKQVEEIREAEESVQLIARSIGEVDAAAVKAAEVGRHTLDVTNQGAVAVRNTIAGMDGIREHIQETSKRIKRLGESSQEIGEIVDLISDITEQTNVLALNAAIQAASAGDAGRGFSVVAEEVQRLAERSAEATKQIGALVKTIQSDTQDAVAAMEKSTLGVVEGAKLSETAGQSLKEIEQVSNELAALINSISVSTQVQTEMAVEVAEVMQDIMGISRETTEGTRLTSDSAARLTSLAAGLKGSVAGFKL